MKTLIQEIQEKYDFISFEPTIIKGFSSTLILEKYIFEIEETNDIEPLRIEIKEMHLDGKTLQNCFRLSIVNCAENDEPHNLFDFTTFDKIDKFITSILE